MSFVLRSTYNTLLFSLDMKDKKKALISTVLIRKINKNLKYKNVKLFNGKRNCF